MLPDATYKTIFSHRFMVEELMRWLVADLHGAAELVDALDFPGLRRVPEQSVTTGVGGQRDYANDIVWQVPILHRPEDDAREGWQSLVVMLEFQSTVDHRMALRIRNYVDSLHMERWRGERFGAESRLAPVLPIVLYNGDTRWTAAPRVIDLVTPGASSSPGGVGSGAMRRASPLFAGDGYLLLDTLRLGSEDLRRDNAAALLAGLETLELETAEGLLGAFHKRLSAPELKELREVMLAWATRQARRRLGVELGDMVELNRLLNRLLDPDEIDAHYGERVHAWKEEYRAKGRAEGIKQGMERVHAWKEEYRAEGRAQGRAEGRAEGMEQGIEQGLEYGLAAERELLCRLAARKFGTGPAERLADLLAPISDTGRLAQVGEWIIDCETGERLIARFGNGAG